MFTRAALFRFLDDTNNDWFISRWLFNFIIKIHCYAYFHHDFEFALFEWIYKIGMVYCAYPDPVTDIYQFGFILCFRNQPWKDKY